MLDKKFYLQHTVDVYVSELKNKKIRITFHRMTTREKLEIVTFKTIAEFLALLNGKRTAKEILTNLGNFSLIDAENLLGFLLSQHLITEQDENFDSDSRYARQIAYLDDMLLDRDGAETQLILSAKKVLILGCGAVTGMIAEILARAGILKFILVDNKIFNESNLSRHVFARSNDINNFKVDVLSNYLKKIDSRIKIDIFKEKLLPSTDLADWLTDDVDLVINGCDEPYIGHTSLKIGRYLQEKNIPLYVAGGFDAHLMSSGELIDPPKTPCIDCIQNTFITALGDWKPTYSKVDSIKELVTKNNFKNQSDNNRSLIYDIGGAGGLAIMSGFSASFGGLKILHFLSEDSQYDFSTYRYEYLPNQGELTRFELLKQEGCHVCDQ